MMKAFSATVVLAVTSSHLASAFAPANQCSASLTALNADPMPDRLWDTMVDKTERSKSLPFLPRPVNLDGSLAGDVGFDPFYLSSIPKDFSGFIQPPQWEEKSLPTLYWMREAELKHGRIAQLAVVGWLATDGAFGAPLRFPQEIFSVESIPNAYFAHDILVQQGTMGAMLLFIGGLEVTMAAVLVQVAKGDSDREAGDFGLDPLRFVTGSATPEQIATMKLKEINHCRLAMLAFGGLSTQAALSDATHAFPYF